MTKPIKYALIAIVMLVGVIAFIFLRRLFFTFNSDKVKAYMTMFANNTADPNRAYELLNETVQSIKKSQDMTRCVLINAEIDQIEPELSLVNTALNQCYANGFIEMPEEGDETIE